MTGNMGKIIFGAILSLIAIVIPVVAEEEFQVSYSCNNCHQDRYEEWTRSTHALAVSDPVFEAAYLRALQSDPKYREYCMSCHSPTTRKTKDLNLAKSISIEGVTCSFCHSVTAVSGNNYTFNQSNPIQGPYSDSRTDAHESEYSVLLTKSEFCAGCHEFSINGVPVYETYSEWKEGPYAAEGKQCQDCHMLTKTGVAANNGPVREKVYQHFWYGGHSGQFLEKAFQIELQVEQMQVEQAGNKARATLHITNGNVGHKVPSGFPSRKVILSFKATDEKGREIYSDKRVYAKTLVDQYGNKVSDFWKATSIAEDNRIGPKETRTEVFEFAVPEGTGKIETQATLNYQLEAEVITRTLESMNVEIAKASGEMWFNRTPLESQSPKESPAVGWIGIVVAMITAIYIRKKSAGKIKKE